MSAAQKILLLMPMVVLATTLLACSDKTRESAASTAPALRVNPDHTKWDLTTFRREKTEGVGYHPVSHEVVLQGPGPVFENPRVALAGAYIKAMGSVMFDVEAKRLTVDLKTANEDGSASAFPGNGVYAMPEARVTSDGWDDSGAWEMSQ